MSCIERQVSWQLADNRKLPFTPLECLESDRGAAIQLPELRPSLMAFDRYFEVGRYGVNSCPSIAWSW